jgi:hypothetical protein
MAEQEARAHEREPDIDEVLGLLLRAKWEAVERLKAEPRYESDRTAWSLVFQACDKALRQILHQEKLLRCD